MDDSILFRYLKDFGFASQHLESYNYWVNERVQNHLYSKKIRIRGGNYIVFRNFRILRPSYTKEGKRLILTPKLAREQGKMYSSEWNVDVLLLNPKGEEIASKKDFTIAEIPVMVKSSICILNGLSEREQALLGEDPNDPGGYFIIQSRNDDIGYEKVVLFQEKLSVNKILLIDLEQKDEFGPEILFTIENIKGNSVILRIVKNPRDDVILVNIPHLDKFISKENDDKLNRYLNIFLVFRLLGVYEINKIKEILFYFIKPENQEKSFDCLISSIIESSKVKDVKSHIKEKIKPETDVNDVIKELLKKAIFPHVSRLPKNEEETEEQYQERIRLSKVYLLAIMLAKFLEYLIGVRELDDKDSWSNKRIEGAGRLMEQLFNLAFKKIIKKFKEDISKKEQIGNMQDFDIGIIEKYFKPNKITISFNESFATNKWGLKGYKGTKHVKLNVTQNLFRESIISSISHLATVEVDVSNQRNNKSHQFRMVQGTQWGLICPIFCPENERAGIVKNLAYTTRISLFRDENLIIRTLYGNSVIKPLISFQRKSPGSQAVMVNGKFLGWSIVDDLYKELLTLRRNAKFYHDTSIIKEDDWIFIDTTPSRPMYPALVLGEDQVPLYQKLGLEDASITELITRGCIEYISAWEQETLKIASNIEAVKERINLIADAKNNWLEAERNFAVSQSKENEERLISERTRYDDSLKKKPYSHLLLDPTIILSAAGANIPWPNHNQAPRNSYQISMSKQALGTYHAYHETRYDKKTKILTFTTRPVVETNIGKLMGLDKKPSGENIIVAFMAMPFTEEDSFICKKEFLENGGFRIFKHFVYNIVVKNMQKYSETLMNPFDKESKVMPKKDKESYRHILKSGLPIIGSFLKPGDCIVGKVKHFKETNEYEDSSIFMKNDDMGIIERVKVNNLGTEVRIKVKFRIMRIPIAGDKFAPRNAQKGTIGLVMPEADLPFTEEGLTPDFIVNPHSIPSRMTMEYLMEMIASKHGAYRFTFVNGTAFEPFEIKKYRETLKSYGKNEFCYETLRTGLTGRPLINKNPAPSSLFMGPVFFQALKHHVLDKIQARGFTGSTMKDSHQPQRGRANGGGLRFGEMERDAVIAYGTSSFLRERLMKTSDEYLAPFCRKCGVFAVFNYKTKDFLNCMICKGKDFGYTSIPFVYKLLMNYLAITGIFLRPGFVKSDEILERIQNEVIETEETEEIEYFEPEEEVMDTMF
jgi:DNA-directed RNA polymerase beta subunit